MKHLKKIFESDIKTMKYSDMTTWGSTEPIKDFKPLDIDYIKSIFSEFYDEGDVIETEYDDLDDYEEVIITIKDIDYRVSYDIDSFIEQSERYINFFEDIKVCMKRLEDEYDNLIFRFYTTTDELTEQLEYYIINIINKY